MKYLIQLIIFLIIISVGFFFYKNYIFENKVSDVIKNNEKLNNLDVIKNKEEIDAIDDKYNIITNLNYKVELPENKKYEINAKSSQLAYENNSNIVLMNYVMATFTDTNGEIIEIISDKAEFNNTSYNTEFKNNVKIKYLNNIITSGYLVYNYNKNEILISDDIIYQGVHGSIAADNILINIITKDIKIFMNNNNEKIKINSN